jgi:hypothetical protein
MRKALLAGIALAGMSVMTPGRAGIPVWCDNCSTLWNQVQEFAQQIQQMQRDYLMFQGIFGQLRAMTNPNGIAMQLFGEQNPLPAVGQITSMLQGGMSIGQLGSIAQRFLNADTIYRPSETDFNATQLNNSAMSLANVQALADRSLESIQNHIDGLQQLRGELSNVSSEADLSAIRGRVEAEQADLQAQGVQAQELQTAMLAQQQIREQQQAQKVRQDDDELLNNTVPIGGGQAGGGSVPPPFPGS